MAEAPQPGSPTPPAAPAAPAPAEPQGLEKVYADFNIEDAAQQFQPQSPTPAAQPQPQAPAPQKFDPFDPNFPAHMERVSRSAAEAQSALHQTRAELTQLQTQLHHERVEADIKRAVGTLTEGTDIKPRIAEVAMEAKAREDARFRTIWQNRAKNPAAYSAALKAFKNELQQEFTVRQDPQLVENQRAVKAAQQQMATTTKETADSKWDGMTFSERRAEMARMRRMGG